MCSGIVFLLKLFFLSGLACSVFSIFSPDAMLKLFVKSVNWKLKLFGLEGEVRPGANAKKITPFWSVFLVLFFGGLLYLLSWTAPVCYTLK